MKNADANLQAPQYRKSLSACAARPGLVAESGSRQELPQSMRLIRGAGGWEKLNTRGAMRMIIRGDVNCEVQSMKCEMGVAIATANGDMMSSCICLPPPIYLLSPPPQSPSPLLSSALSETRLAMSEWQLCSAMSEWRLSLDSASFPSLADYPSVKLSSFDGR